MTHNFFSVLGVTMLNCLKQTPFVISPSIRRCMSLCVLGLLLMSAGLVAQTSTAALSGVVTDPTGAVVVNASVDIVNTDTNVSQTTATNNSGVYSFPTLTPAHYRISVKAPGFKEAVATGVTLHVGDTVSQNFHLELGAATESVSIEATPVLINTEDATVGTVIEHNVVENMPLNGRSFQGLISLSPGVATVAVGSGGSTGQFVVNGQRTDTSAFSVDGVSANAAAPLGGSLGTNGVGTTPTTAATGGFNSMVSVDALQEFKISTSNFAPEYGRSPGAQISLASRSGTNAFHGDGFDYFRNTVLDANDWFLNAAGRNRGVVQQNDFGGVFGGPIIKNRLFFFGSYEGLRLQAPVPSVKQVPTQSARDLAAVANSGGVVGYMAQFMNAYPLPDGNPSTPCTTYTNCTANYTASFPTKSVLDSTSAKIDYNINSNMTVFGRYAHSPSSLSSDNSATRNVFIEGNDVYTAGLTKVIGTSMTSDLRFNFTHSTLGLGQNPLYWKGSLSTVYPSGYAQPSADALAGTYAIQIRGFPTDGLLISPKQAQAGNDQINIVESFGWVKGAHQMKFGADYRQLDPSYDQATFNENNTFGQTTTALAGFPSVQNVCPASALPPGSPSTVPGFICGLATASNLQHNFVQHFRFRQFSFYAQDTWRMSARLTLTYGARWEINPPFQWTSNNPGFSLDASSFSLSNLSTLKLNPFGTPAYSTGWGNISPRIGIAYQLSDNPKWGRVLRAGYGIFYDTGAQVGNSLSNPYNGRFNNVGAGAISPTVQYPISVANSAFVTLVPARLTLPVSNGGTDNLIDPNFRLPFVHQINVTLEQRIGGPQSLTVSYVGALGRDLIGDLIYPAGAGNPNVFAQINPLTGAVTPDALVFLGNYASSSYHSLQTKFQRQFSGGLSAIASYTWSHSIDNSSVNGQVAQITLPTAAGLASGLPLALLNGNSDFDIRHVFAVSAVYDIPTLKSNGISRALLGHWTLAPIYHYQTAAPIDLLTGVTGALGATSYAERPMLIPGIPVYVSGADCAAQNKGQGCPGGMKINTAPVSAAAAASAGCLAPTATNAKGAFCTPAPVGSQPVSGNLGRNVLRGFPLQEFDLSIHRDFPIREQIRIRFQADMFNVFNHPQFGTFGNTLNSTTFGSTTAMANSALGANYGSGSGFNPVFNTGGPRNFQFALKLFF